MIFVGQNLCGGYHSSSRRLRDRRLGVTSGWWSRPMASANRRDLELKAGVRARRADGVSRGVGRSTAPHAIGALWAWKVSSPNYLAGRRSSVGTSVTTDGEVGRPLLARSPAVTR